MLHSTTPLSSVSCFVSVQGNTHVHNGQLSHDFGTNVETHMQHETCTYELSQQASYGHLLLLGVLAGAMNQTNGNGQRFVCRTLLCICYHRPGQMSR